VTIGWTPVVVSLGPVEVRWLSLLVLAGLGLGIWGTLREARARRLPRGRVLDALAWAIPVGVISAWLVHLLGWWDSYLTRPADILRLSPDTLSLWGGLVGGGLVAAAALGHDPGRRTRIFDVAVPWAALGIAVGRLGMFVDGLGQGLPTDLPWATRYTNPLSSTPDFGVPRHPAQLYDGLVALTLFVLLRAAAGRMPDGSRLWLGVAGYGLARVALGAVRLEPAFLFGVQIEQMIAAACVALAVTRGLGYVRRGLAIRRQPQAAKQVA
jgi:phosphatidylglycerol:prolipoprotein diacylglycerol transferase